MKNKDIENVALSFGHCVSLIEEEAYGPRSHFAFDAQTRLPRKAIILDI